jgi:hypothetical protein
MMREVMAKQRAAKALRNNCKVDQLDDLDINPDYGSRFALVMANFGAYDLETLIRTPLCDIDILVEQAAYRESMQLWYRTVSGGF